MWLELLPLPLSFHISDSGGNACDSLKTQLVLLMPACKGSGEDFSMTFSIKIGCGPGN